MQKDTNKGDDNLVGTFSLQIHFFNAKRHRESKRMQLLNAYKVWEEYHFSKSTGSETNK